MGAGRPYVVVVGGANLDIAGTPAAPLVARDSNPGTVRLSPGGVGRNIAHNLALLGVDVRLVTAFGDDAQAASLMAGCRAAGIDISASLVVPGGATSTYLYVTDEAGEMEVAINDMGILEEMTDERLSERLDLMQGAAVVLVDTNLPAATIAWLTRVVQAPVFCDPISTIKAGKLKDSLGRIHTLKPNRLEAAALTGIDAADEWGLSRCAEALLATGLGRVFLSLGADGLLCAERGRSIRLPLLPCQVVNTTGAGDAMMAALVWAFLRGLDLEASGMAGLAASALAVETPATVNVRLCERALVERMG